MNGVAAYREVLLATTAIGETDTVLDIGCGARQSALRPAQRLASG